jgi:uncharacterized protein (DUF342 family)
MTDNRETESKTELDSMDYDIEVSIASDYYKAYISIINYGSNVKVTKEDLVESLKMKNVSIGIDYDAIDSITQSPTHVDKVLIASGKPHVNGKNGEITLYINKDSEAKPKILANGSVDFKEVDFFHAAVAGDVLGVRTMPTEGTEGMTVTGRAIKAKPGKIVNFKAGKNIRISEDGLQMIADKGGSIQFDGDRISVLEVLEIRGDVGVETGNVHFIGKVIITGNVTSGYEVESEESIEINGIVESAKLTAKKDITIQRGIQGNDNAFVDCRGNLHSGFLNNCHLKVSGNIEADSIMHSHVTCDGSIIAKGKKGQVVGGEINVRHELEAKVIGSEMGTITKVRLGVDSAVMERYQVAATAIKEKQDAIKKLTQAKRMIRKQLEAAKGNEQLKGMLEKTNATADKYNEELKGLQKEFIEVNQLIENLKGASVKTNMIYPGAKVRIGNSYYNVKEEMKNIKIQKSEGEIRAFSF